MAQDENTPSWLGRPILHPDDEHQLDRDAAVHEFHHKMPRHEAEETAHREYVKRSREQAAGHHLRAMKGAHAAGDMDIARKHHAMYSLHLKALGHDPYSAPPIGIAYTAGHPKEPITRFKPHKGDLFALESKGDKEDETKKSEVIERLSVLAKAARLLSIFWS